MNKELSLRLALSSLGVITLAYLGFISKDSHCTDSVKVKRNIAVCNSQKGVLLTYGDGEQEILSSDIVCNAREVMLNKTVWMYKEDNYLLKVTSIDPQTHERYSESYYIGANLGKRC